MMAIDPSWPSITRKDAYRKRANYASYYPVTKGFHTSVSTQTERVPSIGACMKCGREYCMFGAHPQCFTCGSTQFGIYDDK